MATLCIPGWCPQTPVMESTHVKRNNVENSCESVYGDNLSMDVIMDLGVPAINRGNNLMEAALECYQQYRMLLEIVGSTAECLDLDELVNRAIDVSNVPGFESFFLKIKLPKRRVCCLCKCDDGDVVECTSGAWACEECIQYQDELYTTCHDCGRYETDDYGRYIMGAECWPCQKAALCGRYCPSVYTSFWPYYRKDGNGIRRVEDEYLVADDTGTYIADDDDSEDVMQCTQCDEHATLGHLCADCYWEEDAAIKRRRRGGGAI